MLSKASGVSFVAFVLVLVAECYYLEDNNPKYLTAAVGDYIILNCEVDFPQNFPIPYMVLWRRGGEVIYSWEDDVYTESDEYLGRISPLNKQPHLYGKASINLTSIRESDVGWFECRIIFPNRMPPWRNNGTWYHLTVSGGNLLAIPPINKTVLEGEEVEFNCITKDYNIKVEWFKDSIPLNEYHDLMTRSWITKDNTLVIRPTDSGDYGEYECEASNGEGEKQMARAFLNVQYKAKVMYAPPEIHLPFGRPALIDCHFRANPPLTNLRWEKDGFLFDPYNIQGVFYRRNGSLYFSKVDESHTGTYTCTPYNELGTAGPSPNMHVTVQRAPIFVRIPHNLYLKKLGETIEMPCDARDGDNGHRPIIVWYKKDGKSLPMGRYSIRDGNLTINDIQTEDRGVYQCSATNKAATITAETELLVENIPSSAPYNITAVSSTTSVHLTWLIGRERANVDYNIWYKKRGQDEWKSYRVPSTKVLEATVTNLTPGMEYEFMVLSKGDDDEGLFSKAIRVWTKNTEGERDRIRRPFTPVGYPTNVTVHPTDNGLMISWLPPEYGLEYLKKYIVRWSQGPDEYIFGSGETKNTSYLITNLSEGNEYDIQVIALSLDDQQAISDKVRAVFPGFKSIRAVSTGIIAGLAFLATAFIAVYYVKKKWCRTYQGNSKN
ncbi:protein borderless [Anoplophora glabripennis]|uniref:protein borderless n=1 Tax=Anoplophora glabripennis TaxID=217634 RepID=UPI0008752064|nr:protein borderless [Anoplophora glabripennis]